MAEARPRLKWDVQGVRSNAEASRAARRAWQRGAGVIDSVSGRARLIAGGRYNSAQIYRGDRPPRPASRPCP